MAQELAVDHVRRILALDSARLAYVLSDTPSPTRFTTIRALPFGSFAPLTQVRKTFQDIPELAEDLATRGVINPPTVYAFPRDVAMRYIDAVNMMWGASDRLEDIPTSTLNDEKVFYILIAGERRFRALHHLWEHGCSHCRTSSGLEQHGTCFSRHFSHNLVPVSVKVGYTPYDALTDQFAENTHHRPRPEEEAIGFRVFFELMRVREPSLTVSEFARRIGHKEGRVRAAMNYTHLPVFIQQAVAQGEIPYTSAVVLERYHRERQDGDELRYWLTRAIAESDISTKRLLELLREDIRQWKSSQLGLFGAALSDMQAQKMRHVFDRSIARALERIDGFVSAAIRAAHSGRLARTHSPFASGGVARNVVRIYRLLRYSPAVYPQRTVAERT